MDTQYSIMNIVRLEQARKEWIILLRGRS